MAQPRSNTRTSFTSGSSGDGGIFANSKFFMKKQNRAAAKIQSLCRAFLVQARLYRQRVLEPRLQEIRDCEARKSEELCRIQKQLQEERQAMPAKIQQEMEDSTILIRNLKQEIEGYTQVNETLKEKRKEEKKKNTKLEQESRHWKDTTFRLDVQNTKLTAEIKERKPTVEKYEWAVQNGNEQMEELEASLLKVCFQQGVLKKYISRMIKLVDEKAKKNDKSERTTSASGPGLQRSKTGGPSSSSSTKQQQQRPFQRSKTSSSPTSSPKQSRKSLHRNKANSKSKKRHSVKSDAVGHASFNWESYGGSKSNLVLDFLDEEETSNGAEDLLVSLPPDDNKEGQKGQADFNWASKSYNSIDFALDESDVVAEGDEAPARIPRRQPKTKTPAEEGGERKSRRQSRKSIKRNTSVDSEPFMKDLVEDLKAMDSNDDGDAAVEDTTASKPRRHSSSKIKAKEEKTEGGERRSRQERHSRSKAVSVSNPLKDLVQELKTIKKEGLKQLQL